jgi:hypothetical protein
LNVKHRVRDIALLEHALFFMESNTVFPAPTLARNILGSNMSLAGFSTRASSASTKFTSLLAGKRQMQS